MAKHDRTPQKHGARDGDDGDWHTGPMGRPSIAERTCCNVTVTSPAVIKAMEAEDAFLASVDNAVPMNRFTDRRSPPGRDKLLP